MNWEAIGAIGKLIGSLAVAGCAKARPLLKRYVAQ